MLIFGGVRKTMVWTQMYLRLQICCRPGYLVVKFLGVYKLHSTLCCLAKKTHNNPNITHSLLHSLYLKQQPLQSFTWKLFFLHNPDIKRIHQKYWGCILDLVLIVVVTLQNISLVGIPFIRVPLILPWKPWKKCMDSPWFFTQSSSKIRSNFLHNHSFQHTKNYSPN